MLRTAYWKATKWNEWRPLSHRQPICTQTACLHAKSPAWCVQCMVCSARKIRKLTSNHRQLHACSEILFDPGIHAYLQGRTQWTRHVALACCQPVDEYLLNENDCCVFLMLRTTHSNPVLLLDVLSLRLVTKLRTVKWFLYRNWTPHWNWIPYCTFHRIPLSLNCLYNCWMV